MEEENNEEEAGEKPGRLTRRRTRFSSLHFGLGIKGVIEGQTKKGNECGNMGELIAILSDFDGI